MGIENPVHLIFFAAVALVVLGPKRLPELARAAGKGMREFRESLTGEGVEHEQPGAAIVQPAAPPSQAPPLQPQQPLQAQQPSQTQPSQPPPHAQLPQQSLQQPSQAQLAPGTPPPEGQPAVPPQSSPG